MKVIYIGIYTPGTTSRMRAEVLADLLPDAEFRVIDTDQPFRAAAAWARTLGFRFKRGPLIREINRYVLDQFGEGNFDLCWVDKAIYLTPATTGYLRKRCHKLIHYTPDNAFYSNRSGPFNGSMKMYDYLVSTKSFEKEAYARWVPPERMIFTTQGFDRTVHKPMIAFEDKKPYVSFVGLYEPARGEVVKTLITAGIQVVVAGKGWRRFAGLHRGNASFIFAGDDLRGEAYCRMISGGYFSLGLLTKQFPELHTTRTFEIPACGTALVTESNAEIRSFFSADEAIFYTSPEELVTAIRNWMGNKEVLKQLTDRGRDAVVTRGFDYHSIMKALLDRALQ